MRNLRRAGRLFLISLVFLLSSSLVVAQDVNIEEIFWCVPQDQRGATPSGQSLEECQRARTLILANCTVCHTFVPIVLQQFDAAGWKGLIDRHRPRVAHLSEEEIQLVLAFLREHFNPENPPPELPPELLGNWTSY